MSLGQLCLGNQIFVVVVYVLSVARVVAFVTDDKFLNPMYAAIEMRVHDGGRSDAERDRWAGLSDFLQCPRCVSIWVAGFSAWIPLWYPDNIVARYAAIVLLASYITILAAPFIALPPREYEPPQSA